MKADEKLDLRNIGVPFCLLTCKSTLASMKPGSVLEVRVQDPESLKDLLTILTRSGELIVAQEERQGCTYLWVEKGVKARFSCPAGSGGPP